MYPRPHIHELSRKSTGIGIVCGLEVLASSDCTLTITEGYGFTSKGILLKFPKQHFKYYQPYEQEVKGLVPEDAGIEVWEALPERIPGAYPISPQVIGTERFIDGKVVFLYLEDPQNKVVRPLVIDKEDLWEILNQKLGLDAECLHLGGKEPADIDLFDYDDEDFLNGRLLFCALNRNTSLKPIYCMRFGFATDESECDPEEREFKIGSADFAGLFKEYELIIVDALEKLQAGIITLHSKPFQDLIPKQQRDFLNLYFIYLRGNRWLSFKNDPERKIYIQYFHDLIKDLASTYNELVCELCQLMADCCPDKKLFPRHLLLGEILEDVVYGPSVFRHHFRQPPIYNDNRLRFQKIRFLHWRMVMQIKNFYIPHVESTEVAESHYTQIEKSDQPPSIVGKNDNLDNIKVTPSFELNLPLGDTAIPYYYYVSADPNSMHHFWSFEAVYCCKKQHLLSYHAEEDDSHTDECAVKRPLAYYPYPHRYYRIEGVIGQEIVPNNPDDEDAQDRLGKLSLRFNIDFVTLLLPYGDAEGLGFFKDYDDDNDFQIHGYYIGAEHIAGMERGGVYLILYEEIDGKNIVTADFSLPTCCFLKLFQPWDIETKSLKGKIVDSNTGQDIEALVTLGDQEAKSEGEGRFTAELPAGSYQLRIYHPDYYVKKQYVLISSWELEKDLGVIKAYPKKTVTIQLKWGDGGFVNPDDSVILRSTQPVEHTEHPSMEGIVRFEKLEDDQFSLNWKEAGLQQVINMDPAGPVEAIELVATGRASFPPAVEGGAWEKWAGRPSLDSSGLVKPYAELWDTRVERMRKFMENLKPSLQKALNSLIRPFIFDFDAGRADLDDNFTAILGIASQHAGGVDSKHWGDFTVDTTEMYLERVALLEKGFDDSVHSQLAKLSGLNILPKESISEFINNWKGKVKGITNPEFEKNIDPTKIVSAAGRATSKGISSTATPLDDKLISKMGPKTKEWLENNGIDTMEKLAALSADECNEMIVKKFNESSLQRFKVSSWPKQAQLFLEGKLDELEKLQKKL